MFSHVMRALTLSNDQNGFTMRCWQLWAQANLLETRWPPGINGFSMFTLATAFA